MQLKRRGKAFSRRFLFQNVKGVGQMVARGELMALGTPWQNANMLGESASPGPASTPPGGLVATGNSQATGLPLSATMNMFITVAVGNQAAVLPSAAGQPLTTVYNAGASTLLLFPAVGEYINGAQNAVCNVPTGKSAFLYPHVNQWIANVSA
jgi:hypothetical protein